MECFDGMGKRHNQWKRKAMALFCLLAVVLLQAPFAHAVWISAAMNCCMGDHCPIPGHHHKSANVEKEMPMDCGHKTSHMSDCGISCCKTTDETVINIAQFVMPDLQISLSLQNGAPETSRFIPQMISRSEKPLSPPPRLLTTLS